MPGKSDIENDSSRRSFLKSVGVSLLSVGAFAGSAQGTATDSLLDRSLALRKENKWTVEDWAEYIRSHGGNVYTASGRLPLPSQDGPGDIQPQEIDRAWITITLSYAENIGSDDYIDISWVFEYPSVHAEPPLDQIRIGWSDDGYVRSGDPWYGSYVSEITDQESVFATGFVAEYDNKAQEDANYEPDPYENTVYGSGCGIPVNVKGSSPSLRRVEFAYHHTWSSTSYSIGIGPNGPVIYPNSTTERWVAEDGAFEDEIRDDKEFTWDSA